MEPSQATVLVVDDEVSMRSYLAAVLRNNGYNALEAPDGSVAINIMRERDREIAVVLSDVSMPHIDGFKLAELNFQEGFLPFVACTVISEAATALKLLKFGVRDYVVKPVNKAVLVNTVRNAIDRRKLPRLFTDIETPLPGNMGVISIPARFAAVCQAQKWLDQKVSEIITAEAHRHQFIAFASEFLMNAYEHGSLMLKEEEKTELLETGGYHNELRHRELECKTMIEVAFSIVGNEIAVRVTDEGFGFDHKRYTEMPDPAMLDRLVMPNGRGIQMAMRYFDAIAFTQGGASVMVTKKL